MSTEATTERRRAYQVREINLTDGTVTIVINKGILGAASNQLKITPESRKGFTIVRKLGFDLSQSGDILFGKNTNNDELNVVVKQ